MLPILTAVATIGSMGLIFGLVLGVASQLFHVDQDPKIDLVRECLPGANCGGCGYAGCDALASAIAAGEAPVGQCTVGGAPVAAKVAEVMGVAATTTEKSVAIVKCNGTKDKCGNKYEYYGIMDCKQASAVLGGGKACEYGCLGLGSCTKVCQFGAISISDDGVAVVNPELCTSCGQCAKACPKGIISLVPYDKAFEPLCSSKDRGRPVRDKCAVGCIACTACKRNCPSEAVEIENNLPRIDWSKCTSCGTCMEKCPQKVIHKLKKAS